MVGCSSKCTSSLASRRCRWCGSMAVSRTRRRWICGAKCVRQAQALPVLAGARHREIVVLEGNVLGLGVRRRRDQAAGSPTASLHLTAVVVAIGGRAGEERHLLVLLLLQRAGDLQECWASCQELWVVVDFVERLPDVTPQAYRQAPTFEPICSAPRAWTLGSAIGCNALAAQPATRPGRCAVQAHRANAVSLQRLPCDSRLTSS